MSHTRQLCLVQNGFVEGVFLALHITMQFVKRNDDFWDVVESHGFGHTDGGPIPPVLLPPPRASFEVVCAIALGCLAPFRVCQLKAVHGRDEVSQGFSGVNARFTSRPEPSPKHWCFAIIEHLAGQVVLPIVPSCMLDGVVRLGAALPLRFPTVVPLTSLCDSFLQRAKFLATFILRAVAGSASVSLQ